MRATRVLAFLPLLAVLALAQDAAKTTPGSPEAGSKRPSPSAHAQCKFSDGKTITVDYSSPRMRGRKIFGDLVPYGAVWRTGANEATTFITNEDVITVNGTKIPAGSYTIFTIPNPDNWALIINRHTGESGVPYKYESEELARVPMSITKLSSPAEEFTIAFEQTGGSCMMHMNWESTQASLEFTEKNTDMPVTN